MSSDENKAAAADKPTEDDGAKKPVTDTDDDEDRVRKKFKTVASITSHQIIVLSKYSKLTFLILSSIYILFLS